jgi:FMN-dependent NADH-azoreductase
MAGLNPPYKNTNRKHTMNILHLDASPQGADASVSRQLSAAAVAQLKTKHAGATVTYRDLATNAPGHLSGLELGGFFTPPDQWNDAMKSAMALNGVILAEFQAADVVVIGSPMYNFGVPSSLKAWVDRVVRAGITFKYGANGPEGLVTGKSLVILSSRGGVYEGTPWGAALDHQEKYLQDVMGFLGVKECTRIRAEGTNMGDEVKGKAVAAALAEIAKL